MTKFSLKSRFSTATIAIAAATVGLAAPAFAQDQPPAEPAAQGGQGDQAIVVTGSRIRRDPLDQDQPVIFVDRDRHRPHRPHLGGRGAAAPAELGRRAQQPLQQ